MAERIAIFPGSFDPFTKGHADIAERAAQLFDKLIIGIGQNKKKPRYFEVELMVKKLQEVYLGNPKITVEAFEGLTAEFARSRNARFLVRGLRNTTDFEYENAISQVNRDVFPEIDTYFLITSPSLAFISSSLVRELHSYGRDVSSYVPFQV